MPAPFGYGIWLWLKDNPAAQWAIGIGAALIALLTWDRLRTNRIRREATRKANDRAEKQSDKILDKMEQESNDRIEAAREARERVPDDVDRSQLSDGASSILFDAFKDRGGGGGY